MSGSERMHRMVVRMGMIVRVHATGMMTEVADTDFARQGHG
jgi:hypothetical protein